MAMLMPPIAQMAIPDGLAGSIGQIGAIGISVWFVYHVTSVMLPKLNKDNNEMVLKIVSDFGNLTTKIVTDFRDEMKLERESHTLQMIAQRDECRREAGLLMQSFQLSLKRNSTTVEFVDSTSDSQIIKGNRP